MIAFIKNLDKRKVLVIALIVVALYFVALGVFKLYYKYLPGEIETYDEKDTPSSNRASSNRNSDSHTSTNLVPFPVRMGHDTRNSNINIVRNLQNVCYYYGAKIARDGVWGKETEAAIGRLREAKMSAISDEGYEQNTTTVQPFKQYINPVVNPSNSQSRWQISTIQDYNAIANMYNTDVKNKRNANII